MTQSMPQQATPKGGNGCLRGLYIFLLVTFGGCTGLGIIGSIAGSGEKKLYDQGVQAYQKGDCPAALQSFNKLLEGKSADNTSDRVTSSRAKKAECDALLTATGHQKAGKTGAAMVGFTNFAASYQSSPLMPKVQTATAELFKKGDLKGLAQPDVCKQIKVVTTAQLIPAPDKNLPPFYKACGQNFEAKKQYTEAAGIYDQFLKQYPKHSLVPEVKAALARTLVAEAQSMGSGNIPEPNVSGYSGSGTTRVVIQNETPDKLRIVFSGPQPRFEELAPCKDCVKFTNQGPGRCPDKGPVGTYTLKPGNYNVLVKSEGGNVTPFTGQWNLGEGSEYNSCFFIVTRSSS